MARAGDHARRSANTASSKAIDGPAFLGIDTHALSVPAFASALEVLAANGVETHDRRRRTNTRRRRRSRTRSSVYNRGAHRGTGRRHRHHAVPQSADDGGFKYNPPNGGPADTEVTGLDRSARQRAAGRRAAGRASACRSSRRERAATTHEHDYLNAATSADLGNVVDMEAIRGAGIHLGVDPLGGAGVHYWAPIAERYGLDLTVVSERGGSDLPLHDPGLGRQGSAWIRPRPTRCSGCIGLKDRFDIAFACDTDHDRHGIVTRSARTAAAQSLPVGRRSIICFSTRRSGGADAAVGKTRGQQQHDRPRGARSSAAALRGAGRLQVVRRRPARRLARLRRRRERRRVIPAPRRHRLDDGQGWHRARRCLSAEITARSRARPGRDLRDADARARRAGVRSRRGAGDAEPEEAAREALAARRCACDGARRREDRADARPCARATAHRSAASRSSRASGWFAARPSGTEDIYKIYAESFRGAGASAARSCAEAQTIVDTALGNRNLVARRQRSQCGQPTRDRHVLVVMTDRADAVIAVCDNQGSGPRHVTSHEKHGR